MLRANELLSPATDFVIIIFADDLNEAQMLSHDCSWSHLDGVNMIRIGCELRLIDLLAEGIARPYANYILFDTNPQPDL